MRILKFVIRLIKDLLQLTQSDGTSVGVAEYKFDLALPFPLALGDGEAYAIDVPEGTATVTPFKVRQDNPDPRLFVERTTSGLARDRYGWLSYTRLEIRSDESAFSGLAHNLRIPAALDSSAPIALNVTNRFLAVYRHVVGNAFVTRISLDEMFLFRAQATDERGAVELLAVMNFPTGLRLATTGLSDEANDRFRNVLAEGEPLAMWSELLLDAREALDQKQLPSAIALGFAAVETACRAVCRAHVRLHALSIDDAQSLSKDWGESSGLESRRTLASVEELVDLLNPHTVLRGALMLSSIPIAGWGGELLSVFALHADARNKLLHTGTQSEIGQVSSYISNAQRIHSELRFSTRVDEILSETASQTQGEAVRPGTFIV